ncbi:MAG: hypothetical protein AAFP70_10465 [Calditrichota bacterium]
MPLFQQLSSIIVILCILVGMRSFTASNPEKPDVYHADQAADALEDARKLLLESHQVNAELLAPGFYKSAMLRYNETRIMKAQRYKSAVVLKSALEAVSLFSKAIQQSGKNQVALSDVLRLRKSAGYLPADDVLKDIWHEADFFLQQAAREHEKNRPLKAEIAAKQAKQLYHQLLFEAKSLLKRPEA